MSVYLLYVCISLDCGIDCFVSRETGTDIFAIAGIIRKLQLAQQRMIVAFH